MGLPLPPGAYVRYFSGTDQSNKMKYAQLVRAQGPTMWPQRIPALAVGSNSGLVTFNEIRPAKEAKHLYMANLGCYPGLLYKVFLPYDTQMLNLDGRVTLINSALVGVVSYKESPYDYVPGQMALWVFEDRYLGIDVQNIGLATLNPKVLWTIVKYAVRWQEDLSSQELQMLQSDLSKSFFIDAGGAFRSYES